MSVLSQEDLVTHPRLHRLDVADLGYGPRTGLLKILMFLDDINVFYYFVLKYYTCKKMQTDEAALIATHSKL